MKGKTLDDVPHDHRQCLVPVEGETEEGVRFRLEVRTTKRRVGSAGIVRAQIRAATRGRPMLPSDLYEDSAQITLYVHRVRRYDLEVTPSGHYRYGGCVKRSLRDLAREILSRHAPRPAPPSP